MSDPGNQPKGVETNLTEVAITRVLRAFFSQLKTEDVKLDFFSTYKKEAEEYDKEFVKKYDEDLNTTLIFAGLFSAVTTSFVLDVQTSLQPDYTQETAALLRAVIQKMNNSTFSDADIPAEDFSPDPIIVTVQVLLYASLGASLLAAFLAVLGKQWLNRYQRGRGGSAVERCRDRQIKADGMDSWYFPVVMEVLPLMLQAALLLLGCALSRYLWTINHVVAMLNIVITSLGVLVYSFLIFLASSSYGCPYQTPFSFAIRYLAELDKKHSRYLPSLSKWVHMAFLTLSNLLSQAPKRILTFLSRPPAIIRADAENGTRLEMAEHRSETEMGAPEMTSPELQRDVSENVESIFPIQENIFTNASCIAWILEKSTDPDVVYSAIRFIPEVTWGCEIDPIPSLNAILVVSRGCYTPGGDLVPEYRDKAYVCRQSLLHLTIQTRQPADIALQIYNQADDSLEIHHSKDPDFAHMHELVKICAEAYSNPNIDLKKCSTLHLSWLCRMGLHSIWDGRNTKRKKTFESNHFYEFITACLSHQPPLPSPMVSECILIIAVDRGMPLHSQDLTAVDKSKELPRFLHFILDDLAKRGQRPHSNFKLVEVLRLLRCITTPLNYEGRNSEIHRSLFLLFLQIIDSRVEVDQGSKWECVRLVSHIKAKVLPHSDSDIPEPHEFPILLDWLEQEFKRLDELELGDNVQTLADTLGTVGKFFDNIRFDTSSQERLVGIIRLALEQKQSQILQNAALEAYAGIHFLSRWDTASTAALMSALCRFWSSLPSGPHTFNYKNYDKVFRYLLLFSERTGEIISKCGDDLVEISRNHGPSSWIGPPASALLHKNQQALVGLLRKMEDRTAVAAWMEMIWKGDGPYEIRMEFGEFTAGLIREEESSSTPSLLEIFPSFISWVPIYTGSVGRFAEAVEICLNNLWKQPGVNWGHYSSKILDSTLEFYHQKGSEGMDPETLHSWLKLVWMEHDERIEEIKSATAEVFRRGGDSKVEGYVALLPVQVELQRAMEYMKLAKDTPDFNEGRYVQLRRQLSLRQEMKAIIEEVFPRSLVDVDPLIQTML